MNNSGLDIARSAAKQPLCQKDIIDTDIPENLSYYIDKYRVWSSFEPEDKGIFIAYASIHGNTAAAAMQLKELLESKGAPKVAITDLSRDDIAEAVEDAFRYEYSSA